MFATSLFIILPQVIKLKLIFKILLNKSIVLHIVLYTMFNFQSYFLFEILDSDFTV
jgi:hypothetical protein